MPVQVGVALLAAQAQRIHPLSRYRSRHGPSHSADHALEAEELGLLHVVNPAFDMSLRGHEAVPELDRVAGEERDGVAVLVQRVVLIILVAVQESADEARSFPYPTAVLLEIESNPRRS